MQLFKYIFVAFYAWQCTIANALLVPNLIPTVPLPVPSAPDLGEFVDPIIPDLGEVVDPDLGEIVDPDLGEVVVPSLPDLGEIVDPSLPDLGEIVDPSLPDLGEIVDPSLPDLGEIVDPSLPDLGEIVDPSLPDLGEIVDPSLPDLGEIVDPSLPDLEELLPELPGLPLGSICRRGLVGRGVGTFVTPLCNSDEQEVAGLCYPKCQNGYENIGSICRKIGCGELDGATDIGVSCEKPKAYGRGAGYVDLLTCVRENVLCEKSGLLYYPTCELGYSPFGCCVCSPNCPPEYIDDGAYCRKPSYDRGVGDIRLGCESDKEYDAGLCYTPCANGIGLGPFCWSTCSGINSFECGIFCTSTPLECAAITLELTTSAAKIGADIAGLNAWDAIVGIYEAGKIVLVPSIC